MSEHNTIQPRPITKDATTCYRCGTQLKGTVKSEDGGSMTTGYDAIAVCRWCFIEHDDDLPHGQNYGPQPCWAEDTPDEEIELCKSLVTDGEYSTGIPRRKFRKNFAEEDWVTVRELVRRGYKFRWHAQHGGAEWDGEKRNFLAFPYKQQD